jgi:hypothetical protein
MLNTLLLSLFHFLGPVYNDAPEPWQLTFQDGANEAPNPISCLSRIQLYYENLTKYWNTLFNLFLTII